MAKFSSAVGIPALGLVLVHFGWRVNFALTGILSVVYFAAFFRVLSEPQPGCEVDGNGARIHSLWWSQPEDPERARKARRSSNLITRKNVIVGAIAGAGPNTFSE